MKFNRLRLYRDPYAIMAHPIYRATMTCIALYMESETASIQRD